MTVATERPAPEVAGPWPWWRYAARRALRGFGADQCTDLAAALTYYAVLAIVPALVALLSLVSLVGDPEQTVATLLGLAQDVAPAQAVDTLREPLESVAGSTASGVAFVLGLVVAIWSASAYVGALSRALNRIYAVEEGRPFWVLRPTIALVTVVVVAVLAVVAAAVALSGPVARAVGDLLGWGAEAVRLWEVAKWPVVAVLVVLVVAVLLHATPNVRLPRFRWLSPGSLVAILSALLASVGLGFYAANIARYDATYGSLAGFVVVLLWVWTINLALLLGAELDAELERARQLRAGLVAEDTLRLAPRDTRASTKRATQRADDVRRGAELRRTATEPAGGEESGDPRRGDGRSTSAS